MKKPPLFVYVQFDPHGLPYGVTKLASEAAEWSKTPLRGSHLDDVEEGALPTVLKYALVPVKRKRKRE